MKKQVGNTVKALNGQYRFQTMGEYRALLSLYNMTVEEARGNVRGREYHGLVYSVTDDKGNKVGNPFKSSLFGKSAGYEAVQKKFVRSKSEIKDRKLADMTKRTVLSVVRSFRRMPCRNTSPCHTPDNRRYRYPSLWMLRTRHTGRPPTTVKIYRAVWACSLPKVRR